MSEPPPSSPREGICLLCGGDNACGLVAGASTCWCFTARIPAEVLDRIPAEARNTSCICQACAGTGVPGRAPAGEAPPPP